VAFTRTSAIYYISIALGLFVTVALDYSFWCALQAEPEFPWKAFPLTLFFLSAYNLVFTIGFIIWLIGTTIFFLEITGYTITRLGLSKNNMGIKKWTIKDLSVITVSACGVVLAVSTRALIGESPLALALKYLIVTLIGMFLEFPELLEQELEVCWLMFL
jgi:energy-coupling factor transport system substrate-specific component